jgi:RNA polymerase sigma factor (TIGR02999 family)
MSESGSMNERRHAREVTGYLARLTDGDERAADLLLPLVYDELRDLASRFLWKERSDHTLQPTALVHEAFLRLVDQQDARWQSRAHFYRVAAQAMRRILVNHARDRARIKRGGGRVRKGLDDFNPAAPEPDVDLVALDDALQSLESVDPRKVQVVQLRYFGGFSLEETAKILEISVAQVKRDWTTARAYLVREMQRGEEP